MANRLVKQAITTYVPAVEEVIAQPARCVVTTRRELRTFFRTVYRRAGATYYWWTEPYTKWVDIQSVQCYPEVTGVEGRDTQVITDNQPGWNAGARSGSSQSGDLVARYTVSPGSTGVLCGLASTGAPVGSFNAVEHGVIFSSTATPKIVERGVQVASAPSPIPAGTEVQIARVGGVVYYRVGDWEYTSATPSVGTKSLYAVLYVAGDAVDDPSLAAAVGMRATGSWGWGSPAEVGQLRAVARWGWGGSATLNDGQMTDDIDMSMLAADYDYGSGAFAVGEILLDAGAGFVSVETSGAAFSIPMSMVAIAIDIDNGQMTDDIDMSMIAADYDYGSAYMDLGEIEGFGYDSVDPEGTGNYSEGLAPIDNYSFDPVLYAVISEGIAVGSTFDFVVGMDGQYADFLALADEATATQVLDALIAAGVTVADNAASARRMMLQYATNAVTGAVARYQGFDFLGFQHTDLGTYAWKSDGLYLLGGDTDDGQLLRAVLDFAAEDFGTAERKRMDNVFLGLSTDGQVFLRMTDDQNREVTYRAVQRDSEYRSNLQRGLSSRFWRMRLELVDASYADLDNVEWVTGATGRRTTR